MPDTTKPIDPYFQTKITPAAYKTAQKAVQHHYNNITSASMANAVAMQNKPLYAMISSGLSANLSGAKQIHPAPTPPPLAVFRTKNGFTVCPHWPTPLPGEHSPSIEAVLSESYSCQTIDEVANIMTMHYAKMLDQQPTQNTGQKS